MASKHGPVSVVSSDGLPPGLVIISNESVPIELHSQLSASQTLDHDGSLTSGKHEDEVDCDDVDFKFTVEDHGASMVQSHVQNLSQMGGHLDDSDRVDDAAIVQW